MRKINYLLVLFLLAIGANWAKADDHTLALGNYDEISEWDEDQTYQGSWWMVAPTQYQAMHTGSQIIYTKEQLAAMAGKEIKSISFKFFNLGAFSAISRTINVWAKEIDKDTFATDEEEDAFSYFEFSDAEKVATDFTFDDDFVDFYNENGDLKINFDKPFAYSGEKNLLITITFDGEETAQTSTDIEFYYNTDAVAKKKAMTTCSDKSTFTDFSESEDWPYATGGGTAISHANNLEQPLTKFTYQEGQAPIVKPAQLSGTVRCGEDNIAGATVTLTYGETGLNATTDAEGKYIINIDKDYIGKEFTLTAKAEGYDEYTATQTMTFSSDEKKTQDIELVKTILPAQLSGTVKCGENNISGATITLTNGDTKLESTTDAEGKYIIDIDKDYIGKEFTLTAKAEGYDNYTAKETISFSSDEEKTLDIALTKKDVPSVMTGKVTADDEPIAGATVKLTAADKTSYKTTTGSDGSYVLNVVKSEKTYTLSVTSAETEDYTEENITFTPGKDMTKDIALTRLAEPENSISLGSYTKFSNGGGTDKDLYYGHGYSWAAAPTNLSHKNTGSQIIYTKEQLQKMAGKAISKIGFVFHNENAYDSYPRTVKVWMAETDNDTFEYDTTAKEYKFFDYSNDAVAIDSYQYDGEIIDYAGGDGELLLEFDKPVNYSGEKNLLLTITFEGENCCNTTDFNFYCNNEMKNKAMSYFNDSYTFGDFADTEDWPFTSDDCVSGLEQPVTRFFYTEPTDGIHSITTAENGSKNNVTGMYNLAGQSVTTGFKGIIVKDGKKFVK